MPDGSEEEAGTWSLSTYFVWPDEASWYGKLIRTAVLDFATLTVIGLSIAGVSWVGRSLGISSVPQWVLLEGAFSWSTAIVGVFAVIVDVVNAARAVWRDLTG